MQPKFIELPEKKIVGLGAKFISILSADKNNMDVIPRLWHQFVQREDQIQSKVGGASYGVVEMLPESAGKSHRDELFYIACVEVANFDSLPAGMIHRVIPAGRYAQFTHKGKLDGLEKTMRFIHGTWVRPADVKRRKAAEVEVYDRRFNPGSDQSEFDILLPIE